MKRLSLAMMSLAVAGLMTMVSCRKPVNQFNPTGEKITFSATTENNSKTYAEEVGDDMYVKWSEGDEIRINGNYDANLFKIGNIKSSGTEADFTGWDVGAVSGGYLASYPKTATNYGTTVTFTVPDKQDNGTNLSEKIPMVAYTTEKGGNLQFKNMVNILQLNLTGNQSINKIEVESANEYLSGNFTVGTNLSPNYINYNGEKKITITKTMMLNQTPQPVYVLLPVFRYETSQISIKFTGDDGTMTIAGKTLSGSNTPNHRYKTNNLAVNLETNWYGKVETTPVCAIHATCASCGGEVYNYDGAPDYVPGPEEQGVIWAKTSLLGDKELTFENYASCGGGKYVFNYEYDASGSLTPKRRFRPQSEGHGGLNETFTAFMSGLDAGTNYTYRAYIREGTKVLYDEIEPKMLTFTTLSSEPDLKNEEVDFDLDGYPGLKWAKYNLGANVDKITTDFDNAVPYDWYGDYYMWGDNAACNTIRTGYSQGHYAKYYVKCGLYSCRFAANVETQFTKYCITKCTWNWYPSGTPDGRVVLEDPDDCVIQTLGDTDGWRLPTTADVNTNQGEWYALHQGALWVYTTHYAGKTDLRGYVVYKVKNGSHKGVSVLSDGEANGAYSGYSGFTYELSDIHIFLPSAGYRVDDGFEGNNIFNDNLWWGYYLSRSYHSTNNPSMYALILAIGYYDNECKIYSNNCAIYRYYGCSVRPVRVVNQ